MSGIKATLSNLRKLSRKFENLLAAAEAEKQAAEETRLARGPRHLSAVKLAASNPGDLGTKVFVPEHLPRKPALVVVLHGCDQTAESYDRGSGWSALAERLGFVLLYPEQLSSNNAKNCFSWFLPADVTRGEGEVHSIHQMIEQVAKEHDIDRRRIFVTGLSAGGAMTAALLATYPDVFAAGAIIGGLPYGSARSVQEAFEIMFSDRETAPRVLGDRVRGASQHRGTWPRVSIWHGRSDQIVRPSNADESVRQWTNVHGLSAGAAEVERLGRHTHRKWKDAKGKTLVEEFSLQGMGHGVPISTAGGAADCGTEAPFFIDAGLSSTYLIAQSWGLAEGLVEAMANSNLPAAKVSVRASATFRSEPLMDPEIAVEPAARGAAASGASFDAARVIASAFKAAGLSVPLPATSLERGPSNQVIDPAAIIDSAMRAAGLKK